MEYQPLYTKGEFWRDLKDNSIILAFRGTDPNNKANIALDEEASIFPCTSEVVDGDTQWCGVHMGFVKAYTSLMSEVQKFLNQQEDLKSLYITGHSLGAAMAVLASYDIALTQPGISKIDLFTYGQPRIGDKQFTDAFTAATSVIKDFTYVRLVNTQSKYLVAQDWVTELPPLLAGYDDLVGQTNLKMPKSAPPVDPIRLHSAERYFNETLIALQKTEADIKTSSTVKISSIAARVATTIHSSTASTTSTITHNATEVASMHTQTPSVSTISSHAAAVSTFPVSVSTRSIAASTHAFVPASTSSAYPVYNLTSTVARATPTTVKKCGQKTQSIDTAMTTAA